MPNPHDQTGSHSNRHGDTGGVQFPGMLCGCAQGVSGVGFVGLWDIESGQPISVGKVNLPYWWIGLGKLAELLATAINECLLAAKPAPPSSIPILLGVADRSRPHRFAGLDRRTTPRGGRIPTQRYPQSRFTRDPARTHFGCFGDRRCPADHRKWTISFLCRCRCG